MKQVQKGFTLIELMIVVAIIGILAAIAIPAYSDYQSKAKLAAGLAEVSGYKTAHELFTNDGGTVSGNGDISMPTTDTANCGLTAAATTLSCAIKNAPTQVGSATITWTRNATTGVWSCATTGASDKKYAPKSCPQA
ncbi:pilin [Methylotenera sp. N17]|uniref:pilin n=1 Tax=Methylotenera sp. N17 TaxID=1502761 RepID=UPI0006490394|nr:pilin [Methylotenera sp. N17]